jgi:hypothetical protein
MCFPDVSRKVDERLRETKSKRCGIAFLLTSIRLDSAVGTGVVFYAKSG